MLFDVVGVIVCETVTVLLDLTPIVAVLGLTVIPVGVVITVTGIVAVKAFPDVSFVELVTVIFAVPFFNNVTFAF